MNDYIYAQPMRSSELVKFMNVACIPHGLAAPRELNPDNETLIKNVNKIYCSEIYHNLKTGIYQHQNAFLIKYKVRVTKSKGFDNIPVRTRIDDYTVVTGNSFNGEGDSSNKVFSINLKKIGIEYMDEHTCYMMIVRDESDIIHIIVFKFKLAVIPLTLHDITDNVCDCKNNKSCPTKICKAYNWCVTCNGEPDNYKECLLQFAHNKESNQLRFRELIERCRSENCLSVKVYRNVCRLYAPNPVALVQPNTTNQQNNVVSKSNANNQQKNNKQNNDLSYIFAHNFDQESQKERSLNSVNEFDQ